MKANLNMNISMVSCQKGPTRHADTWQIGPFWQDTLDMCYDLWLAASSHSRKKVQAMTDYVVNTMRLRQNDHHFADQRCFQMHFSEWPFLNFD